MIQCKWHSDTHSEFSMRLRCALVEIREMPQIHDKKAFERETLFFELNPAWGKALQKMEQEAIEEDDEGKTLNLEEI